MTMHADPEKTEVDYLRAFADFNDAHILEIGCGDGRLTWRYAQRARRVTAIDPDPARLASALEACPPNLSNTVTFTRAHSEKLPFSANTFNGAILAWSL
jgi:ubiquinone/menaquinone biosynthesis C-methylase UbiE